MERSRLEAATESYQIKIQKLKEAEEQQLAESAKKRKESLEDTQQKHELKIAAKALEKLKEEKLTLTRQTDIQQKENLLLEIEANSLKNVVKLKTEELNKAKETLNNLQERIWKERESFTEGSTSFIDRYGILSDWWNERVRIIDDQKLLLQNVIDRQRAEHKKEETLKEIERLEEEIKSSENEIIILESKNRKCQEEISELELKKDQLEAERFGPQIMRIKDAIKLSKSRCNDLQFLISEKKRAKKRNFQNSNISNTMNGPRATFTSELFSVVDVKKIRKFSESQHVSNSFPDNSTFNSSVQRYFSPSGSCSRGNDTSSSNKNTSQTKQTFVFKQVTNANLKKF